MKTSTRFIFLAALVAILALTTYSFAQGTDTKIDKKIERRIAKVTKKLHLSEAQVTQVREIITASKPQIMADRQKIKNAPDDQRAALLQALKNDRSAVKDKLLAVLNPEQRTKAEKFIERHKKEGDEHNDK